MNDTIFNSLCLLVLGISLDLLLALGLVRSGVAAPLRTEEPGTLQILIRMDDGAPVAGIQVTLRPAPADLGGPATPLPAQEAVTDATGGAQFHNLGQWVWYAIFSGTVGGQPLQPPADQGKPPWGTNPVGNGFPLVLDLQLENQGNLPTLVPGETASAIYPFVLVSDNGMWLPALDVAEATATPIPLPTVERALAAPTLRPAPVTEQTKPSGPGFSGLLIWLIIGGVGLVALYRSWRQWTHAVSEAGLPAEAEIAGDREPAVPPTSGD